MSVSTTATRASYSPGGSTTVFAVPFKFNEDNDLVVVETSAAGADVTKTLTTDYTVAGAGDANGGSITMVTAPASGTTLSIYRDTDQTQAQTYTQNDSFPAESHEAALDKLTLIVQELEDQIGRCLKIPRAESTTTQFANATDRASKYPVFDTAGNITVTSEATISYPDDDLSLVSFSQVNKSAPNNSLLNITLSGGTAGWPRLCRIWANDSAVTYPTTTPPAYSLWGTPKKYWEVMLDPTGANQIELPPADVPYKVTFEIQGAARLSLTFQ